MAERSDLKGQTLIETAFVLVLLLLILFGIAEFSRAWFTKSSLKNAVRHGARIAAVTNVTPAGPEACTGVNAANFPQLFPVCNSPGVPAATVVKLELEESSPATPGSLTGDTVRVEATVTFDTSVSGLLPLLSNKLLIANAAMRHE